MRGDMQGSEAALESPEVGHHQQIEIPVVIQHETYGGLLIHGVAVVEQQSSCFHVVLLSSRMQCGQADLASGVTFEEQSHHLLVALLESHSKRCEAILRIERNEGATY